MARAGRANSRIDTIVLGVCAVLSLLALALPQPVREPVAANLRRNLLAPMVMLQQRAELSRRALVAHDSIVSQRDSIALRALDDAALQRENDRLRQLIGLGARLRWGFIPAEALHGRSVRDETTLILSAGSAAGVQRLSPVVAPEGLVGLVDNVDPTMSHAIVWTHPDFRVSAMAVDSSAFGIAQAHVALGPGRSLMELRGVPFRTPVKLGTLIVSSGLGGVWPAGIPLGRVIGEVKTSESWARSYLIRPAVFPADVNSVMILRPERAAAGVESVWNVGGTTEASAMKRVVVAGDSMARTAALAEAEARRAAHDSAARDSAGIAVQRDTATARPLPASVRPPVPTPAPGAVPRDSAPLRRDSMRRDSARVPRIPPQ